MPSRWVICPVVTVNGPRPGDPTGTIGHYRIAKAATLIDPQTGRPYPHTAWITDSDAQGTVCLALVHGQDLSALTADPQIVNLLSRDIADTEDPVALLSLTPRQDGWNQGRVNSLRSRLAAAGHPASDLGLDTPLADWIARAGEVTRPGLNPRQMRV